SRIEIINGKVNAGVDYTYALQPKKTGAFTIGPAEVKVKGKTIKSNAETLTIVKSIQSPDVDRGPLFLSAALSPKQVFVEEQAIYTLKLFRQARVGDISLGLPEAEHLTFKQLGKPVEYQSVYKGQSYQVLEVRYALVSSREGIYGIRHSRMSMTVFQSGRKSSRGLFDDPFFSFSSGQPVTISSEPLELNALPLPQKGRPTDFSGLVGNYKIESHLEPSKIRAGESATMTVLLSGRGNVKRIPDLKLPELEEIKVYADQPVLMEETDSKGLFGSKTMKWALVPEKEGEYQIPSLSISFFDTTGKQYRVIKSPVLSLSVLPVEKAQAQVSQDVLKGHKTEGPGKQEVKELGHDILPVHTSIKNLHSGTRSGIEGLVFWLILIIPLFAYAATFLIQKFHRKTTVSVAAARARKAAKALTQQCRKGELSSNDLTSSIRRYLNERFDLSLGSLTSDEAADIVVSKGVSAATAERLRTALQELEDAIYTGKGQETCDMGGDIPKLIKQIEKEIR
ncbi:MAG: BatD family protein, partial [Proteobacteria bacterium]|nr:BatD family protein [Pseudomonadota bacterium]